MATMTITIPDNKITDVLDSLSELWGFVAGAGETKAQFVRRTIMEHLELSYRRGKRLLYEESFVVPPAAGIDVT